MTGYDAGMRRHRVTVLNRTTATAGPYGSDSAGIQWEQAGEVWASVDWQKGKSAMREGSLDVYAVVIVRMNWNDFTTSRSRIVYEDQTYKILGDTFHSDHYSNTIQFHAQMVIE